MSKIMRAVLGFFEHLHDAYPSDHPRELRRVPRELRG